jgi:hypothetical protein
MPYSAQRPTALLQMAEDSPVHRDHVHIHCLHPRKHVRPSLHQQFGMGSFIPDWTQGDAHTSLNLLFPGNGVPNFVIMDDAPEPHRVLQQGHQAEFPMDEPRGRHD